MVRHLATVAVSLLLLTGCGDGADRDRVERDEPAPTLLTVQRNGGSSATLDFLTVHRDGTATLDKRYGAGRRPDRVTFILRAGGRTSTAQLGALGARERPLFRALEDVIAGGGRR